MAVSRSIGACDDSAGPHPSVLRSLIRAFGVGMVLLVVWATYAAAGESGHDRWIVVTAPAFEGAIAPLCDYRRHEGLDVVVVRTTDILTPEQLADGDARALRRHIHGLYTEAQGRSYVLLVGAAAVTARSKAMATVVPALRGTIGRMKGQPSDNGYGCPDDNLMPTVAVGRFPVRTEAQARQIVQKTLAFERDRRPGPWRNHLTLLIGNPGGASPLQRRFAEWFVQTAAAARLDGLNPLWTCKAVVHASGSPFNVPDNHLDRVSRSYLEAGQIFSLYLGHSAPSTLASGGVGFLNRQAWAKLNIPHGPGVLFTCGCYGCQLEGLGGEGYGLAAIRNPNGPVGVIGAHGESYAAMGQLALDGTMECLKAPDPQRRLADYWLAVKAGLASGPMDPATFWLYDQADGSRGKVPLEVQRLEHLEMWMLLGDPALRIPVTPCDIQLKTQGRVAPGGSVEVTGSVRPPFNEAIVRLTLERPVGSVPVGLEPVVEGGPEMDTVMMANHDRANSVVIASCRVHARNGRFEGTLKLPSALLWPRLIVRAVASTKTDRTLGVLSLPREP